MTPSSAVNRIICVQRWIRARVINATQISSCSKCVSSLCWCLATVLSSLRAAPRPRPRDDFSRHRHFRSRGARVHLYPLPLSRSKSAERCLSNFDVIPQTRQGKMSTISAVVLIRSDRSGSRRGDTCVHRNRIGGTPRSRPPQPQNDTPSRGDERTRWRTR